MATSSTSSLDDIEFTATTSTPFTVSTRSRGLGTGPGTGMGTGRGTGASTASAAVSTGASETPQMPPSGMNSDPQTAVAVGWTIAALFFIFGIAGLLFFWRWSKRDRPSFRQRLRASKLPGRDSPSLSSTTKSDTKS